MLIAFHKPYAVLSQFNSNPDEPISQRTLAEFALPTGVSPLGRLDMDSEGLLLLSDDPSLERRLLHPSTAHERTYIALVDGNVQAASLAQLTQGGLIIRGHSCRPCEADVISQPAALADREPPLSLTSHPVTSWLRLTLTEGKNRQVRRMTAAIGHPTLRLVRTAIAQLVLADLGLAPGEWTMLDQEACDLLFNK